MLSKQRALAALNFLVKEENLSEDRFVARWYGESRPITSNASDETRALNRRIEIKGQLDKVERSKLYDQYRTQAAVKINGQPLKQAYELKAGDVLQVAGVNFQFVH